MWKLRGNAKTMAHLSREDIGAISLAVTVHLKTRAQAFPAPGTPCLAMGPSSEFWPYPGVISLDLGLSLADNFH